MLKKLRAFITWILKHLGISEENIQRLRIIVDLIFSRDHKFVSEWHNNWGDLWKEYYWANRDSIPAKLALLKQGLATDSQEHLDLILDRYVFLLPWRAHGGQCLFDQNKIFTLSELEEQKVISKRRRRIRKNYRLPEDRFEDAVFQYRCGLDFVPPAMIDSVAGTDIIDGGAFIGDSALILGELGPQRIYAFEPEEQNYQLLLKTILLNDLADSVIPLQQGIGRENGQLNFYVDGSSSTTCRIEGLERKTQIEVVSIDDFVTKENLKVGLIKLDIEGHELAAIMGARRTILKFKPLLLVSIYHTPEDFFEIKPWLESLNADYKFIIRKLTPFHPTYETTLIAIPKGSVDRNVDVEQCRIQTVNT